MVLAGDGGQFVTAIPSRQLMIVRLGLSRLKGAWDHETFIAGIVQSIPDPTAHARLSH
jgi:hypothetical protein